MVKRFLFKCLSCSFREIGIIPFNLTLDNQVSKFNENEEEFMRNYNCPKCDWSEQKGN